MHPITDKAIKIQQEVAEWWSTAARGSTSIFHNTAMKDAFRSSYAIRNQRRAAKSYEIARDLYRRKYGDG